MASFFLKERSGQSLTEVLVSVTVGTIMILGAIAIILPALKTSTDSQYAQIGASLGKQLLDNVRATVEGNWHAIDYLSTTSLNHYYLSTSTSPFTVATGTESVVIATTTYSRYFTLDDVYRNVTGKIINPAGGSDVYDPSTKLLTITYTVPQNVTRSFTTYLTRSRDQIFDQTDWAGGTSTAVFTVTSTLSIFTSSTNIDTVTSTGSVVIQGF